MYKIVDNFLSQEELFLIQSTFFPQDPNNPNNFTWNYQKGIVRDPELGPTGYEEHDWIYIRQLYSTDNGLRFDRFYPTVKPIIDKLKVKKLFDIRANLLVPTETHIYHEFHTDRKVPHQVALFYVTTCNGFTVLKNTVEVECVENRLLLFDSSKPHRSTTCSDDKCRVNINFNFF